jgi:hypothetical protein
VAKHECGKEEVLDIFKSELSEIKKDVKELLKFKYQVLTIAATISALTSLVVALIGRGIIK